MKKLFLLLLVGFFLNQSCRNKNDCSDVFCTMEFAMLMVKLSSVSNPSLNKIRTESILVRNKSILVSDSTKSAYEGNYFGLATDAHMKELGYNSNNSLIFKVFQGDSLIYTGNYVVATDCCHISLKEGKMAVDLP